MPWYRISPKVGVDSKEVGDLLTRLPYFILEAHRVNDRLRLYLYGDVGEASLRRVVGVVREDPPIIPIEYYYTELRQDPQCFHQPIEVLGWDDVYELLENGVILQVTAWRDPKANRVLSKKARELLRPPGQSQAGLILSGIIDSMMGGGSSSSKQQYIDPAWLKERQQQGREVLKRAAKPMYIVRIRLYGPDKRLLKDVAGMIASRFTRPLKVFAPILGGKVGRRDPRRIPGPSGLLGSPDKELLWMPPEELTGLLVLPDPSVVQIDFVRGTELPRLAPERALKDLS